MFCIKAQGAYTQGNRVYMTSQFFLFLLLLYWLIYNVFDRTMSSLSTRYIRHILKLENVKLPHTRTTKVHTNEVKEVKNNKLRKNDSLRMRNDEKRYMRARHVISQIRWSWNKLDFSKLFPFQENLNQERADISSLIGFQCCVLSTSYDDELNCIDCKNSCRSVHALYVFVPVIYW